MLQIATGKLFTRPPSWQNLLRGMLYTNAYIAKGEVIETAAGKLLPSTSHSLRPFCLVYEFTERMEQEADGTPGIMVSSTVDPYLNDFAALASFALNCICTPDFDLARRLTGGERGLSTRVAPQVLVRRFFNKEFFSEPGDLSFLSTFIDHVIGLHRGTFLGVMRAIRTYVNAMHRIADDLELAYALLVASVESLAQDFDGHPSDWDSVDERKRRALDAAMEGVDDAAADHIRGAIVEFEHVALTRRFREFVIAHTTPFFFREAVEGKGRRLGKSDLVGVLNEAYNSRSRYVHNIQRLPPMVSLPHDHSEMIVDDRIVHLTLQGLSRLMRSVIIDFIMQQPTVDREPYDYRLEREGVIQARMAPQYWVGNADGNITKAGRDKLEDFLEQLEACLLKQPAAALTDMRPVLAVATGFVPTTSLLLRRPYLALHVLFNLHVSEQLRASMPPNVQALAERELDEPSPEALVAFALYSQPISWPLTKHQETLDSYLRRRTSAKGLRLPRLFEAAITLELAERYRDAGDMERCRAMVALAVENHPGHDELLALEGKLADETPIEWRAVLLPGPTIETPDPPAG